MIFNLNTFYNNDALEIFKTLFFGIRFDISAIAITNLLILFLHIIPGNFKSNANYQKILKIIFFVVNGVFLFINFADIEYFKFTNKRSTFDLLNLITTGDDMQNVSLKFIIDYWYILILFTVSIILSWRFYPKLKTSITDKVSVKSVIIKTITSGLIITAFFFIYRGVGYRPLSIITAAEYTSAENIPLVLNSTFTFIRTSLKEDLEEKEYFTKDSLDRYFSPIKKYPTNDKFSNKNVVIIILESFGKEYTGYYNKHDGYTPFLDSLAGVSLSFENSYANGKKSMEAVPSIVASLPSLITNPFITSKFSANEINSLASILKTKNYNTSFYHGGNNGTMGFDTFSKLAGFDNYFGRTEYPNKEADYDGNWGIFDEPYLKYFCNELSSKKQPFLSTIFTLSSHHPYTVPDIYKDNFAAGTLPIHKSIRYTDYSLKLFFDKARSTGWYKNTIFIITADHTSLTKSKQYKNSVGIYSVPIIFFEPSNDSLIGLSNKICQHCDIMPSVLDYLNYDKKFISYGNSVFDNKSKPFSINYINGIYQIIKDNFMLQFDGKTSIAIYNIKKDSLLKKNLITDKTYSSQKIKLENEIKAIIQSFNNRMIKNNLTVN